MRENGDTHRQREKDKSDNADTDKERMIKRENADGDKERKCRHSQTKRR